MRNQVKNETIMEKDHFVRFGFMDDILRL